MKNFTTARISHSNSLNSLGNVAINLRKDMVIFSGNSNKELSQQIADILQIDLGNIKVG